MLIWSMKKVKSKEVDDKFYMNDLFFSYHTFYSFGFVCNKISELLQDKVCKNDMNLIIFVF